MKYSESLKKNKDFNIYIEKGNLTPTNIWSCMYWKMGQVRID